jgi:hypothetical protein
MPGALQSSKMVDSAGTNVTLLSSGANPFSGNVVAGESLVAFAWVSQAAGTPVCSVAGGAGAAWVQRLRLIAAGGDVYAWVAENVTGGDNPTIDMSVAGGDVAYPVLSVHRVSGVSATPFLDADGAEDVAVSGPDSIAMPALTFTGSAFILAAIQNYNSDATPNAGTGFTNGPAGWSYGGTNGGRILYGAGKSSGVVALGSPDTGNTATHAIWGVALLESGGGPPPSDFLPTHRKRRLVIHR